MSLSLALKTSSWIGPRHAPYTGLTKAFVRWPQKILVSNRPLNVLVFKRQDLPLFTERYPSFAFHYSVRNLGVVLESTLTFSKHVANLTQSSYFHPRSLRFIYVTLSACLPLPSLFVRYAHLTVIISLSRVRGLLWLKHERLQSLTLRFGTNTFRLRPYREWFKLAAVQV